MRTLYVMIVIVIGLSIGHRLQKERDARLRPAGTSVPHVGGTETLVPASQALREVGPSVPTIPAVAMLTTNDAGLVRGFFKGIRDSVRSRKVRLKPPPDICRPPECVLARVRDGRFAAEREVRDKPKEGWQ